MEKKECKIGMRVKSTVRVGNVDLEGQVGTIVEIDEKEDDAGILVEFDNNIKGHDGSCSKKKHKAFHCWWVEPEEINQLKNIWDN